MSLPGVSTLNPRTRRRLAWAAPVVVAGVVAGGVALATAGSSGASTSLTDRTPQQLLTAMQTHTTSALYGQVREVANLGLPELPGPKSTASLSWPTFLTGTHYAKVWLDGRDKQRVALSGELSEAEIVHNGKNVWTYVSDTDTVTHSVLAQRAGTEPATRTTRPDLRDLTPAAAAAKVLQAVRPSTSVSVGAPSSVAGHDAYLLVIKPRNANSTVGRVTIAIDAKRYVPLRVQIFGGGRRPAFETGFTSVTFAKPAASRFDYTAPEGATVSTDPLGTTGEGRRHHRDGAPARSSGRSGDAPLSSAPATSGRAGPTVIGRGWTAVVELPKGAAMSAGGLLERATTPVGGSGSRLLHTALVNAVFRSDGRVFVGAVTRAFLEHLAATR